MAGIIYLQLYGWKTGEGSWSGLLNLPVKRGRRRANKMTRLKLTIGSKDKLYKQGNATGVVYIKSGEKEITSFEFYRGRDGKFYIITDKAKPYSLTTLLEVLAESIPEEE